jgi:hypothetical protein
MHLNSLRRAVQRNARMSTSLEGEVIGFGPGVVTVQVSRRGRALRNIPFVGEAPSIGERVIVEYNTTDKPRARRGGLAVSGQGVKVQKITLSGGDGTTEETAITGSTVTDAESIEGVPVNFGPTLATNQQVLIYDNGSGEWINGFPLAKQHVTIVEIAGALGVSSHLLRFYNVFDEDRVITKVFIAANTAPIGADIIVDVNVDGTTIFTTQANRATIIDGSNTGESTVIENDAWNPGSYITVDVDQIGSGTPGDDLTVHIVSVPNV